MSHSNPTRQKVSAGMHFSFLYASTALSVVEVGKTIVLPWRIMLFIRWGKILHTNKLEMRDAFLSQHKMAD
jgi:hypothetical protein